MSALTIRPETRADCAQISVVTEAAFADVAHSDGSEENVIQRLRADGDLALSLVAEDGERIIGHVARSPVRISNGSQGWFGLGPVSVLPASQRGGVGSALINRGIADVRETGARGIVLLGDPSYYVRFGFRHDLRLVYAGPPPEYFQRPVLDGEPPAGTVTYAPGFG